MAYRKTEKVLANAEAKRKMIIAAAIDLISRHGMELVTTDGIAERAGVAAGLIYKYFPDKTELMAAVTGELAARDLATLRSGGIRAWAKHLAANYRLMSAVAATDIYRLCVKAQLATMIKAAGGQGGSILPSFVFGAVLEAARTMKPRDEAVLLEALRRAMGVKQLA